MTKGFCYLLAEGRTGRYKIGSSKHPNYRKSRLQTGNSNRLGIICTIASDDMEKLEDELHERYAHKKVRGEWFILSFEDVVELRSHPDAW